MNYENRLPDESVNYSKEHPLKELMILLGGLAVIICTIMLCLHFFIGSIAKFIPFHYEQKLAAMAFEKWDSATDQIGIGSDSVENSQAQAYLQNLANELAGYMNMEDMPITVHYSSDDVENAFATIGGHVFMYKGLIERLPNENALSTVLAHEIAHVKHRHPMVGLSQGLTVMLAVAVLGGMSDKQVSSFLGGMVNFNQMSFSRDQETDSDFTGIQAAIKKYGHAQGTQDLFRVFEALENEYGVGGFELFSTHPLSTNRIKNIDRWAKKYDWTMEGKTTPMPDIEW